MSLKDAGGIMKIEHGGLVSASQIWEKKLLCRKCGVALVFEEDASQGSGALSAECCNDKIMAYGSAYKVEIYPKENL